MKILNNLPAKTDIQEQIGNLGDLKTILKNNLVSSINSLYETFVNRTGTADISDTGDGTVTGAIKTLSMIAQTLDAAASQKVANNDTTTSSGYVADARIVKIHGDEIDALKAENSSLNWNLTKSLENKQDSSTAINIENITEHLLEKIYPVGSVYMSEKPASPATFLGGTWVQIKDRFLLGAGSSYTSGSTGGEASHVLSEDEMPRHQHTIYGAFRNNFAVQPVADGAQGWNAATSETSYTGRSAAHNNMPPYYTVHIWRRTA